MRVCNTDGVRLAFNHINAGYSNLITDSITTQMKQRWGPFAYLKSAASQLREREEYHTRIRWDDGQIEVVDAVNVFIANGRTVAGGLRIAPEASMEDGTMQVVVNRAGSLVDMAGAAARMLVGNLLESDHVISRPARSLHIESTPPMAFSVDGEPFCEHCVEVRVVPGAVRTIVGPNYVVEPALEEIDLGDDPDFETKTPSTR
jgi:diacylglycerol kinase (ATP)